MWDSIHQSDYIISTPCTCVKCFELQYNITNPKGAQSRTQTEEHKWRQVCVCVATCMAWCVMRLPPTRYNMCFGLQTKETGHHPSLTKSLTNSDPSTRPPAQKPTAPGNPGKPKPGDSLVPYESCRLRDPSNPPTKKAPIPQRKPETAANLPSHPRKPFPRKPFYRLFQRLYAFSPANPRSFCSSLPFFFQPPGNPLSLSRHVWCAFQRRRTETDSYRRESQQDSARLSLLSNKPSNTAATQPGSCICVTCCTVCPPACVVSLLIHPRHFYYPFWQVLVTLDVEQL